MRILVTGGGLIGSAVAGALAPDHEVTVFDAIEPPAQSPWQTVTGDIRDAAAVTKACTSMDRVVHTAALHGIHMSSHTGTEFMEINVTGTYNVLAGARDAGVSRVVISSSTAVFAGQGPVLSDDLAANAGDIYGLTKLFDEGLADFFRRTSDLEVVALRYGAIWQLIQQIERADVQSALGNRIDLLALALGGGVTDLRDAVAANVAAVLHEGPLNSVYTILPTTPGRFFDASRTERELGIKIEYGRDDFLQSVLSDSPPNIRENRTE